ncbi:hypothetical protein NCER_101109 [Vairimorpha ceranae BRL01]|uniref:Phosphatidylinositol transfer protein N-terminal domain-containing protein n=2 Tax=Vairimorpha ceranae TaxID=40302 RepID=C4V993_VAIC1|nr:phosphatidylinositol transfer protein [Vairimorpha ceranae]EEQ82202.1 hypothetical protein NCER_101109 [Vairimorpha ceranae BRL01]KAF5140224.1 hypothetical protein G9O61_00g016110 [Vairimorpha ceranae]KKO76472.1 phosphatidylinositol transfer protein [Vairimorpha ceranae]
MTKISKLYELKLPLKKSEYNNGNRYASIHKYKKEKSQGYKITLIKKESNVHDTLGKVNTTIKYLHLHSKIPTIVRKCIPDAACILTEISHYSDKLIETSYKNNHFSHDVFNVKIETRITTENPYPDMELEVVDYSNGDDYIKCYKRIDVEINNWMMGWIAHEISESMKNQILEHHQLVVNLKDEWCDISVVELDKLENELYD